PPPRPRDQLGSLRLERRKLTLDRQLLASAPFDPHGRGRFGRSLALAPTAEAYNPQIAGLQIALRQHGLHRGPIDAVQGPKTVRAVRTFQRRHRLAVDGIAGPRTRAALGPRGRPLFGDRVIRRGMRGYDVGVLQFLLKR